MNILIISTSSSNQCRQEEYETIYYLKQLENFRRIVTHQSHKAKWRQTLSGFYSLANICFLMKIIDYMSKQIMVSYYNRQIEACLSDTNMYLATNIELFTYTDNA